MDFTFFDHPRASTMMLCLLDYDNEYRRLNNELCNSRPWKEIEMERTLECKLGLEAPFHVACASKNLNDAKLLLETQSLDGWVDRQLNTTCILASKAGFTELVMQIPKDAILCQNVFGESPLTIAACSGNLSLLTWLIDTLRPDLTFATWEGKTLLALAAENGRLSCVTYLLSIGCESLNECASPLELAAKGGFVDVLEALVPHSTKDNVSSAFLAVLTKPCLDCCELLLRIGNIDTDSIYDSPAWASWFETRNEAFVLWLLKQLSNSPTMAPKLRNVAYWMQFAACWTPSLLERVLACVEMEVSAELFSHPEFWKNLCAHGNTELLQWLLDHRIDSMVAVPSALTAANRKAVHLELRLQMTKRLLESRNIAMARQLEERDAYMKKMMRGKNRSHEIKVLLESALEANNLEGLDWLCGFKKRPLEVIFNMFAPSKMIKFGAETMRWLMRRGWKPQENVELRVLSVRPEYWPTVHTTRLSAEEVLETLRLLGDIFKWKGEELSAQEWPRESSEQFFYHPVTDFTPLAWAAFKSVFRSATSPHSTSFAISRIPSNDVIEWRQSGGRDVSRRAMRERLLLGPQHSLL